MLYVQTRGELHSLDKGRCDSDGVDPHDLHDPTTQIRAATTGGQVGDSWDLISTAASIAG